MSPLFTDIEYGILDYFANVSRALDEAELFGLLSVQFGIDRETYAKSWKKLNDESVIIKKENSWIINPDRESEIKNKLHDYLSRIAVDEESVFSSITAEFAEHPDRLQLLIRCASNLAKIGDSKFIVFVDGERYGELGRYCDDLAKRHIMFRHEWSSRNHSYVDFNMRIWPFDFEQLSGRIVLHHLHVRDLSEEEWRIICLVLFSESGELTRGDMIGNTRLTTPELDDAITKLRGRGLLEELPTCIRLRPEIRPQQLGPYFASNIWPDMRGQVVSGMKHHVRRSLANLSPFLYAKRLHEMPTSREKNSPVKLKVVDKSSLEELGNNLKDMKELGLAYDLHDAVTIPTDVINDVESWLKGAVNVNVTVVPAKAHMVAHQILKDIFSKCQEYVKIQDEYIDEDTLHLIELIPHEFVVKILTGLRIYREDPGRLIKQIERQRALKRGRLSIEFVGSESEGIAPFHDRYIITKSVIWQIGTSMSQLGGGKESSVTELPNEGASPIELSFDRLFSMRESELKEKSLVRLPYSNWKSSKWIVTLQSDDKLKESEETELSPS